MSILFSVTVFALICGAFPYLTEAQGLSTGAAGGSADVSRSSPPSRRGASSSGSSRGGYSTMMSGARHHRRSTRWRGRSSLPCRTGAPLWLLVDADRRHIRRRPRLNGRVRLRAHVQSERDVGHRSRDGQHGWVRRLGVGHAGDGPDPRRRRRFPFDSFRLAWTVQYAVWIFAVVGILVTRRKTRRLMRLEVGAPPASGGERMLLESWTPTPTP